MGWGDKTPLLGTDLECCDGGKEASGPGEVPVVPCLALGAGGSFVLARRERDVGPGSADTGALGEGETRGRHRHASSPPSPVPPVGRSCPPQGTPQERGERLPPFLG